MLTHTDASWRAFEAGLAHVGPSPAWALLASLGPLALFAGLGLERPREDREWMLVLWPPAAAVVYFFGGRFAPHALAGLTLPLSVLAVRGWHRAAARLCLSLRFSAPLAAVAVLGFTVPSAVSHVQSVHDDLSASFAGGIAQAQLRLTDDERRALAYVEHARRSGGVLAPQLLSLSVPEFTGRQVFVGHGAWEPPDRLAQADAFFDPSLRGRRAAAVRSAVLRASRATFVITGCGTPATFGSDIASVAHAAARSAA